MGKRRREEEYKERFKKGSAVEVSSEDSGLRGSWYTATVIRSISATTHKILVEYHNLYSDDSGCTKLREFVDAILVRPIPPRHPRLFSLMDDVDAFHNDGWWEGVVTRVFPHHSLYSVFFRCSREQIDFPPSDLRLHREWLHHNLWLPPPPFGCIRKRKNWDDTRQASKGRVIVLASPSPSPSPSNGGGLRQARAQQQPSRLQKAPSL